MTRKLIMTLSVALLAIACATTDTAMLDDGTKYDGDAAATVIAPASTDPPTHDAFGLPTKIESPIGQQYPSSAAGGAGNITATGTNTNLNPAPAVTIVTEPAVVTVTQTEIAPPPAPVIIEAPRVTEVVIEEPPIIEPVPEPPRVITTKD